MAFFRPASQPVGRGGNRAAIQSLLPGEGQEQRFIGHYVVKNAGEESGLRGGLPQIRRAYPGEGKETSQFFGVPRKKSERIDSDGFRFGGINGQIPS